MENSIFQSQIDVERCSINIRLSAHTCIRTCACACACVRFCSCVLLMLPLRVVVEEGVPGNKEGPMKVTMEMNQVLIEQGDLL